MKTDYGCVSLPEKPLYSEEYERAEARADRHETAKAIQGFFLLAFLLCLFTLSAGAMVAGLVQLFSWGYGLV